MCFDEQELAHYDTHDLNLFIDNFRIWTMEERVQDSRIEEPEFQSEILKR